MEAPKHYKNTLDEGGKQTRRQQEETLAVQLKIRKTTENEQQTKEGQQKGEEQNDIAMLQEELATLNVRRIA